MAERETVQPQGRAEDWTDDEIAALTGITADGRISPAVLADAKADAIAASRTAGTRARGATLTPTAAGLCRSRPKCARWIAAFSRVSTRCAR